MADMSKIMTVDIDSISELMGVSMDSISVFFGLLISLIYTPPAGDNVNFSFTGSYTPPNGDAVNLDL